MEIRAKSKKMTDLKAYLEKERSRLQDEISHGVLTTDEERAGYSNHMAEEASFVFEQARNVGLHRSQELLLGDVEDALRRMTEGTYGTCRHCGIAIDPARLRVQPTASLCVECQELQDAHVST